jgi:hypothetical protein
VALAPHCYIIDFFGSVFRKRIHRVTRLSGNFNYVETVYIFLIEFESFNFCAQATCTQTPSLPAAAVQA